MTVVGPGTWEAARAAADCAIAAAALVVEGTRIAYALCRPPGHHATPAGFGGSCYLNNAAVAASFLRESGVGKVGIVDVDAHQGNGTAAIFYARDDVLYGSVHVDPAAGWFPHVVGHASETGTGPGLGATRNLPLPPGTGDPEWLVAVEELAGWVVAAGCEALVVSLGVDAAADDPESPLLVTASGYRRAGALLGATGLPAVVVQEGGYHLPTLGPLVAAYLEGHAEAAAASPASASRPRPRPRTCECDCREWRGDQQSHPQHSHVGVGSGLLLLLLLGVGMSLVVADDPGELATADLVAPDHDRLGVGLPHGHCRGR